MNSVRSYDLDTAHLNALRPLDECIFGMADPKLLFNVDKDLIEGSSDKSSLMSCAEAGALHRLQLLIKHGVGADGDQSLLKSRLELKTRAGGWSAMHFAVVARENVVSIIKCLLDAGADPLAKSNSGVTPLDLFEALLGFAGGKAVLSLTTPVKFPSDPSFSISRKTWTHHSGTPISEDARLMVIQLLQGPPSMSSSNSST